MSERSAASHSPIEGLGPETLGLEALEQRGIDLEGLKLHAKQLEAKLQTPSLTGARRQQIDAELTATKCAIDIVQRHHLPAPNQSSTGLSSVSDIFRQQRPKS